MVIKSKNKIIIIVWLLLLTIALKGIITGISYADKYLAKDYFGTQEFEWQLNTYINYLSIFELNSISATEAKNMITVSKDEIEEHRYRYGDLSEQISSINLQYEQKIQDAIAANNQEIADFYIAERDMRIEDITKNFTSDEHVKAKIIKEKEEEIDVYFRDLENNRSEYLSYDKVFNYYLINTETGEIFKNENHAIDLTKANISKNPNLAYIKEYKSTEIHYNPNYYGNSETVHQIFSNKKGTFEGYISVEKTALNGNNNIVIGYQNFKQHQIIYYIYAICGIIAATISYYIYRKKLIVVPNKNESWYSYYNRIPIDLKLLIFIITFFFTIILLIKSHIFYYYGYIFNYLISTVIYLIFMEALIAFTLIQGYFLYQNIKDWKQLKINIKESMIYRFYQMITDAFIYKSVSIQIFLSLGIVFGFGMGATIIILFKFELFVFYVLAFIFLGIPLIVLVIRRAGYFNRIVYNTNELITGNLGSDLPVRGKSQLAILANNINQLKYGVESSLKEQAKSERLKTELITNVSHDLRTPLTSIITYTELLKNPDLTKEERDDYIQIIDRKSIRLKVLIDDLFEASKMASGNIELVREKVDLVQLLQQTLAEHNDRITESTLKFKVSTPTTPIYAIVDGKKLWRVFDNLIENILKYSLENTRVYITMEKINDKVTISFKNVSKYELGENTDELFERFKRGDTSRQTEGSGLGLAIAKSIIDLHGGRLEIEVDGDLFKATVSLSTR